MTAGIDIQPEPFRPAVVPRGIEGLTFAAECVHVQGRIGASLRVMAPRVKTVESPTGGAIVARMVPMRSGLVARLAATALGASALVVAQETAAPTSPAAFDLEARREHWCWRLSPPSPPPTVASSAWPRDPLDAFVLANLEAHGLAPAPDADPALWLRRVSFDLIGLPPTEAAVRRFGDHPSEAAYARVVDDLLASPHFGERWTRHWLDLVRYAETLGHESDYEIPGAWRYRDYVIRAFNADLPYDRFVQEHVAGDLLPESRLHPDGFDEAPIGTAFFWFGDQVHSPVDVKRHTANRIDNQIDVATKTFLGVTVSCARCHDHKFDAIPQTDYYALYGVLQSSRYALRPLDPADGFAAARAALAEERAALRTTVAAAWTRAATDVAPDLDAVVTAPARPTRGEGETDERFEARSAHWDDALAEHAKVHARSPARVRAWLDVLQGAAARDRAHPLHALAIAVTDAERLARRWEEWTRSPAGRPADDAARVLADAGDDGMRAWFAVGSAFAPSVRAADVVALDGKGRPFMRMLPGAWATSGAESLRLQGALASPTFTIDRRYLWIRAAGERARFNVVLEGFNLIRDPIYGGLRVHVDAEWPRWYRVDLSRWRGREAYVQLQDLRTPDPCDGNGHCNAPGFLAVQQVHLSDSDRAPDAARPAASIELVGASVPASVRALAARFAAAIETAVARWCTADDSTALGEPDAALLSCLSATHLLDGPVADDPVVARVRDLDARIAESACVPTMVDGDGRDAPVFRRGDPWNLAAEVPRRGLAALPTDAAAYRAGSGRLTFAREITRADHPLTSRVLVNRVWHHLFGEGLVPTVDNLGVLGVVPSHPRLLDHLAREFVADGWSIKRLIRRLTLSRTYRLASSHPDPRAASIDPDQRLLHRARVRRLDGESVRDATLLLAGRLDPTPGGPSIPVHLTEFLQGRGRPGRQGPLDGAGRRSVYQEVRRNFLNPMFLVFDTPIPFTTIGDRNVSNVPAQALTLMNDAFFAEMAGSWAEKARREVQGDDDARAASMLRALVSRAPTALEIAAAVAFVREAATDGQDAATAWRDLAHALLCLKEFTFLR